MGKLVRVELGEDGTPVRIFRRDKRWLEVPFERIAWRQKAEAVGIIRRKVFDRSKSRCEQCERFVTWESFEMHERIFKSRGGEVSMDNSIALCKSCHQTGPNAAHKDRRWQTAKVG